MSETHSVTLRLTLEQAEALKVACDQTSRLMMGQVSYVTSLFPETRAFPAFPSEVKEKVDPETLRFAVEYLATVVAGSVNGSYGIHSPEVKDRARVLYDILQVLRNALAFHRKPEGGFQVDFDTPYAISQQPLPVIAIDCE